MTETGTSRICKQSAQQQEVGTLSDIYPYIDIQNVGFFLKDLLTFGDSIQNTNVVDRESAQCPLVDKPLLITYHFLHFSFINCY